MSDFEASVWVDEDDDFPDKMMVTVAIEGQVTHNYLIDKFIWQTLKPELLSGEIFLDGILAPAASGVVSTYENAEARSAADVQIETNELNVPRT